ncbi:MAG: anthranilate synthase component I [Caulobacterales bacterium]
MAMEPGLDDFAARFAKGGAVVWTRRLSDLETPVSALLKLGADQPGAFLFESVQGGDWRGRYSIIGMKPDLIWRVRNGRAEISTGRFEDDAFKPEKLPVLDSLRKLIARSKLDLPSILPAPAAGLFGYLGYDMVRFIENLPDNAPDPLGQPDAMLMRPTVIAVFDNVASEITLVTPVRKGHGRSAPAAYDAARKRLERVLRALDRPIAKRPPVQPPNAAQPEPVSNFTQAAYKDAVSRCKDYARIGDIFQVVPSQRFSVPLNESAFSLYRSVRRINPSPFLFYLNFDKFAIVGSSPEILVRLQNDTVTIRPIAGTRPRGKTHEEDLALEQELLADPKERSEHLMLLDLGRNDVGRVARRGKPKGNATGAPGETAEANVRVTASYTIERYSHVMHIVSNVEGHIAPGLDAVDALFAGFPAGTVSGAPKVRAMEIINEMEPHKRGVYAGGVGYFSANGDMDTAIALRTGIVKDGRLYVQAGGGVVLDSDPQLEFEETQHKARALIRAAAEAWRYA